MLEINKEIIIEKPNGVLVGDYDSYCVRIVATKIKMITNSFLIFDYSLHIGVFFFNLITKQIDYNVLKNLSNSENRTPDFNFLGHDVFLNLEVESDNIHIVPKKSIIRESKIKTIFDGEEIRIPDRINVKIIKKI